MTPAIIHAGFLKPGVTGLQGLLAHNCTAKPAAGLKRLKAALVTEARGKA